MLRYIIPIIIAGGQSSRFGSTKALFFIKSNCVIDQFIFILARVGFFFILINGKYQKYTNILDATACIGPLGLIYTIIKLITQAQFLIVSIDMINVNYYIFVNLIFKSKNNYTYFCNYHFFPILIKISINQVFFIKILKNKTKRREMSLFLFKQLIIKKKIKEYYFKKKEFININTKLCQFLA